MKIRFPLLSLLTLISFLGFSQTSTLKGLIFDEIDNSPLIGVNILFGNNQGSTSNSDGQYNINLQPGINSISFQYMGYKTFTLDIFIKPDEIFHKS